MKISSEAQAFINSNGVNYGADRNAPEGVDLAERNRRKVLNVLSELGVQRSHGK